MRFNFKVIADDGAETPVSAGQRDMAAWERQFRTSSLDATKQQPLLFFRFLAYSALKRTWQLEHVKGEDGKEKLPDFDTWDAGIESVDVEDDEDDDPTQTDQSPAD